MIGDYKNDLQRLKRNVAAAYQTAGYDAARLDVLMQKIRIAETEANREWPTWTIPELTAELMQAAFPSTGGATSAPAVRGPADIALTDLPAELPSYPRAGAAPVAAGTVIPVPPGTGSGVTFDLGMTRAPVSFEDTPLSTSILPAPQNPTVPASGKTAEYLTSNELLALVGKIGNLFAGGFSTYETSRLQGRLMASQAQGNPVYVTPQQKQDVKQAAAQKIPWSWIIVGAVLVTGVLVVAVLPSRKKTVAIPAMKALPAPV